MHHGDQRAHRRQQQSHQAVQDLVWSLYNKVDFVFNY